MQTTIITVAHDTWLTGDPHVILDVSSGVSLNDGPSSSGVAHYADVLWLASHLFTDRPFEPSRLFASRRFFSSRRLFSYRRHRVDVVQPSHGGDDGYVEGRCPSGS